MPETIVQLPPNSTGIEIRVLQGDGITGFIPSGVTEEAVVPTDAQGLPPGDARQARIAIEERGELLETMTKIARVLERIELVLTTGLDVDINPEDDLEVN